MSTSQKFTYKGKEYLIKKGKEYTATYKKYQREQVKAANGEMKMTAESDYIYDATTERFVVKKRYINSRNGGLKAEFAKKGYKLNQFGNIESPSLDPKQNHIIFIRFEVIATKKEDTIDGRKVDVDYQMTFLNEDGILRFNNATKDEVINKYILREKNRIVNLLAYYDKVKVVVQAFYVDTIRDTDWEDVKTVKMFGCSSLNLSSPAIGAIHDGQDTNDCVPRAIHEHLKQVIKKITIEDVLERLNTSVKYHDDNLLSTILSGYDSEQVMRVFTYYNIPCYALDHRRKCFLNNLEMLTHVDHHFKSFVYMCWNQHMYTIENDEIRRSIFRSENKMKIGSKVSCKTSKTVEEIPMVLYEGKDIKKLKEALTNAEEPSHFICSYSKVNVVNQLFFDELQKGTIHDDQPKRKDLKIFENVVTRFRYDDHVIEYQPAYTNIKNIVNRLNEPLEETNKKLIKKQTNALNEITRVLQKHREKLTQLRELNQDKSTRKKIDKVTELIQKKEAEQTELEKKEIKLEKLYSVRNTTFHGLAMQYFERNFGLEQSQFGAHGRIVFDSPLNSAFNEFWEYPENLDECHAYDIRKQYSSLLMKNNLGWSVYSPMDEIKEFNGKLQEGFYFVKTSNYFPMKGDGWYSGEALIEYVADNIIQLSDITHEYVPTNTMKGNYFEEFVNDVFNKYFGDNAKTAINAFIGTLRIDKVSQKKNYFFNDIDSVFRHMGSAKATFNIIEKKGKESQNGNIKAENIAAFHVIEESSFSNVYTSSPVHRKIYDMAALQCWRLVKAVGGVEYLWGIRTDALFFNGGIRLEPNEHEKPIGGFRHERIKEEKECNFKRGQPRTLELILPEKQWNDVNGDIDISQGCLTTGHAGTGKSYNAKQLMNKLNEQKINYAVCAPTKAAAMLLISGKTIHNLFGFDVNKPVVNYSILKQLMVEGVKVVFVDEVSMINANIWGLMLKIKQHTGFTFYGYGDAAQCAPVGEEKVFHHYLDSALCHELFDGNRKKLTVNHRCKNDPEFAILNMEFMKAREGKRIDASKFGTKVCDRAIAFTNYRCGKHNELMMNRYKNDDSVKVGQMYIYEGLPVIANKNSSLWSNNEQFTIKSYNAKVIKVESVHDERELDINRDVFGKFFEPAYCTTVHSAQGQTFNFEYTIYEYNCMSTNVLYTALSRTTKREFINLVGMEVRDSVVYCYVDLTNNKRYIGSTVDWEQRQRQHLESDATDAFHKALRQKGIEKFEVFIVFKGMMNERELIRREQYFINRYNTIERGYNTKRATLQ